MPKATQASTLTRLLALSKKRLAGLAWRLDANGHWHSLTSGQPKPVAPAVKKSYFLALLARDSYQEAWHSYTIRSARALKKVLELKRKPNELFYIGAWQQGKREVLSIRVDDKLSPELQKARLVFPETLVLGSGLSEGLFHVQTHRQAYYLHKKADGSWQTLLQSKLINSTAKAKLALGCPEDAAEHSLNEPQLREALAANLTQLPSHFWTQGWQPLHAQGENAFPWQKLGIGIGVIAASYLLLSSLYLYGVGMWSQQRLEEVSPQVVDVLTQQEQLQRAQQQISKLNANLMTAELLNQYWTVIATLSQAKATLDYSTYNGEVLTLGGQSRDALSLLRQLYALPEVSSAEFATPLRSGRGGQTFRIDITLTQTGGEQ